MDELIKKIAAVVGFLLRTTYTLRRIDKTYLLLACYKLTLVNK